jgi:hypothetical protein
MTQVASLVGKKKDGGLCFMFFLKQTCRKNFERIASCLWKQSHGRNFGKAAMYLETKLWVHHFGSNGTGEKNKSKSQNYFPSSFLEISVMYFLVAP